MYVVVGILNTFLPRRQCGSRWWCAAASGWVGTTDDPKAPVPQLMPPSENPVVLTATLERAGGRRKGNMVPVMKATAQLLYSGSSKVQIALLEPQT